MKRLTGAALMWVVVMFAPANSASLSSVVIEDATISVIVPIAVVGGDTERLAAWARGIDAAWNRGNDGKPFVFCGRAVRLVAHFMPRQQATAGAAHLLLVESPRARAAMVSSVWRLDDRPPTIQPRTAVWSADMPPNIAAHEFGHLLGLPDEYIESDENGNGTRDPGEGTVPDVERYPDAWLSLMAFEHGAVLERHVRDALIRHGAAGALDCVKVDGRQTRHHGNPSR